MLALIRRSPRALLAATGELLLVLRGHIGSVSDVSFDARGSRLATSSTGRYGKDNSVKIWESEVDVKMIFKRANASNARKKARPYLDDLFVKYDSVKEVLQHVEQDNELDPEVKRAAKRLARFRRR